MHDHALRPATRLVHHHLAELGDAAIGLTLEQISDALSLSGRAVRRASIELEHAGIAHFARTSSSAKCVSATAFSQADRPQDRANVRETDSVGPSWPTLAQRKRARWPKLAQTPSLLDKLTSKAVAVSAPARERTFEQQQQRQQLLALEVSDGRAIGEVRRVLDRLDAVVRDVWQRVGRTHGFLAVDERTVAGLDLAMRRYPLPEIEACVVWSAERVAAGSLSPGYFATTFRGNAFGARYAAWQADLEAAERRRRQDAAIAADIATHRPEQAELTLSGAELERLGRDALAELERMAGGQS